MDMNGWVPSEPKEVGASSRLLDIGVYGARGIPGTYSGYETFLSVLLPELVERGHKVTMYCRTGRVSAGGDYHGVKRIFLSVPQSKEFETLAHGLSASFRARLAGHDLVFVVNVANSIFCLLARITGQRTVLNTDGQEWLRGKWGPVGKAFFRMSARSAALSASALVSDSKSMARIYKAEFHSRSTVIPYCWTEIDEKEDPDVLDVLGLDGKRYFLMAGRLIPENNIDRVAAAYLSSTAEPPLVVLGEANYDSPVQRRLQEMAASSPERLILAGHIGNRGAFAVLIRKATAYFHGHSVGGINPSLVEAMGCGARILAFDTPFNREALADAGTYFREFEHELPLLFQEAACVQDPENDIALRNHAAARARSLFTVSSVTDAHEVLFRTVRGRHPWHKTALQTPWVLGKES